MAVGRAARFDERRPRVVAAFGDDPATLRLVSRVLELAELAWHDCYGDVTPPEDVVDDALLCSRGTLAGLIEAVHLAVVDRRDLAVWASDLRSGGDSPT